MLSPDSIRSDDIASIDIAWSREESRVEESDIGGITGRLGDAGSTRRYPLIPVFDDQSWPLGTAKSIGHANRLR
jgi:hypothetical protein